MLEASTSRRPSGAERLRGLAALFLVTALPLAAWTPFHDCFPLTKWLLLLGAAGVVAATARDLRPVSGWAWLWAGWLGIAALWSPASGWESLPAVAVVALPPLVAAQAFTCGRLARALVITAVLMAVHGLTQAAGWDAGSWLSPFHKGVASTIGNPDLLGGFLILPFAIALALTLDRTAWRYRAAALLLGLALLATEARAAWLGAGAAGAVLACLAGRRAAWTLAAVLVVTAGWLALRPDVVARARSGGAMTERVWTWRLAARIVRDTPVAGTGPGSFRREYLARQTTTRDSGATFYHYTEYAHLEPLHLWVETGAIGLGLFCWGLVAAFRGWWRSVLRERDPGVWRGIGAGAAGVLVDAGFSFPFHVVPTAASFWLLLGAAAVRVRGGGEPVRLSAASLAARLAVAALLLAVPFRLAVQNTALRDGQALALAGRLESAAVKYAEGRLVMDADPRLAWYAAACERQRGDPAVALTRIDAAVHLEPGMYELHHERGMTLKVLNRLPEAEAAYRQAVRINPGFASGWNNLGNLLGAAGRLAEAEAAQHRALTLDPASREARQNLAITLLKQGRDREARAVLEEGVMR